MTGLFAYEAGLLGLTLREAVGFKISNLGYMSKNKYFKAIFIILAVFGLSRVYFRTTDDFRIANIVYQVPHHPEWEVDLTPQKHMEIKAILQQKFHYLGKGAQSYAFASDDQRYVLKFFKFKHLKPSLLINLIPPIGPLKDFVETQKKRKMRKLESVFEGYRLGYAVHREDSGLIFVHLNKTHNLGINALVKDKIKLKREIALDDVVFILQDKAQTTRSVIIELLEQGKVEQVSQKIEKIFNLYLSEYAKGIYDRDHGVMHNTGFVGEMPIHLDIGKLTLDERMKSIEYYKPDLVIVAKKFITWTKATYPHALPQVQKAIESKLSEIFNESFTFNF